MMRRLLSSMILCATLAGCAAVSGFPDPVFSKKDEDAELRFAMRQASVEHYAECVDKLACRNAIIDARVRAIDISFYRFQRRLYGQEARTSLGADMASMAMDAAATVTGTRPLAAAAGFLTGSRDSYEKQAMTVSLPLLFEEMVANRREVLLRIRTGEVLPVTAYTLIDALGDTSDYELAGSIPAAAAALSTSAGTKSQDAEAKLVALRTAAFANAQPAVSTAAAMTVPPQATTASVGVATSMPTMAMPTTTSSPAAPTMITK